MTQLNPETTDENIHTDQTVINIQMVRNASWIAALLAVAGLAFFSFAISAVNFHDWEDYLLVGFPLLLTIVSLVSVYFIQRGYLELGSGVVFILNLMLPVLVTIIVSETGWAAFLYIAVSSTLIIWRAMPRRSWRWATIITGLGLIVVAFAEFINSPNRLIPAPGFNVFVSTITAILVVAFVIQAAHQAWTRNNIRSRFLTFSLGLTLIAATIIAATSVSSLFSAGRNAQETSSQVLRDQIQETLGYQTGETAIKNDLILQGIGQDAEDVAQQVSYIFENPHAFNSESFWRADEHMFFGPDGQYINGEGDVSTVFVPNTVQVSDNLKQRLELLAYLDMTLVPVYEGDPNSVAIYFVGKDELSWLHPNINLGAIVPADYLATQDIFYTIGAPENNPERQVVWTPVYDDPGGQGLLVSAIAPVYSRNTFVGVIGIDVSLAGLTANMETESLGAGEGSYAFMLDTEGRALALPEQGYTDFLGREREAGEFGTNLTASTREEFSPIIADMLAGETGFQNVVLDDQEFFVAYTTLESTGWLIASVATADQVLAPVTALQTELENSSNVLVFQRILPVGIAIVVLVVVAGIFFTNRLVNPIEQLTEGAAKIGQGEWDTSLPQSELVEVSSLSSTLSTMSVQLKNMIETLEQRVADRTRNLVLAAEVGRSVSQVRELDVMLRDACELILGEFDLYYVQVYLTDPGQRNLVLEAGTGEVGAQLLGRGHSLPLNTGSINGRAAVEKRTVLISDTAQSSTFRPNALLPETRGEMAVPLIVADKVVGVLDMQSSNPGALNEEVLPAFEALAGQLAVAVQNANLLKEAEQARAEVEAQARRLVRTSWDEHLDAIHKPEKVGYVFDRNEVTPFVDEYPLSEDDRAVSAPISVTGETLGSLVVELNEDDQSEQTSELVRIVARQVAQQLENLRLLESAERYRFEAEQAARRQTREGWQTYVESRAKDGLGYLYDLREVRPYNNGHEDESALTLPLRAGDETVGKVSVQGLAPDDSESVELANAVVERLSAHIENLRLFEETQTSLAETQSLYRINEAISGEMDIEAIYQTVAQLSCDEMDFSGSWIAVYEPDSETLRGVAGINMPEERIFASLSINEATPGTMAAKVRQPVTVNDPVKDERMLDIPPDVRARMGKTLAMPVIVGQELLGVIAATRAESSADIGGREERMLQAVAIQLAIVMQRVQLFEQVQKQAERESLVNAINQKIQSATSVEAVLQIAARELGHALGAPMTIAQLSMKNQN